VPDVSEATASAAQSAAAQMQETLAHALEKSSDMQVCDTVGAILVAICCVLALAVCFFGYRIYKFAFVVFAFLIGFGIEASVGSAWLAHSANQNGTAEKVIILVCAILWGTLFLVLAKRYRETIEHLLGFVFGICLGFVLTIAVLYIFQTPIDNALGTQYQGWENFAGITLGVPIALLVGYLCRNSVMILVMVVTSLIGAAAAWRWGKGLIACADKEDDPDSILDNNYFNLGIFVGLALLGLGIQMMFRPRSMTVKSDPPSSVPAEEPAHVQPA